MSFSICAIVLSYKRPQNMQLIVDSLLAVPIISKVILSNNNPEIDITQHITVSHPKFILIEQESAKPANHRFALAAEFAFDYYFCIDDDLFLSAEQIQQLLLALIKQPERVHGMYGQHVIRDGAQLAFRSGIYGEDTEVDVLNRAYAFTRPQLFKMLILSQKMGFRHINDAQFLDDVLLSFSGKGKPLCHDVGVFEDCPTSHAEGIAVFRQATFEEKRIAAYQQLESLQGKPLQVRHRVDCHVLISPDRDTLSSVILKQLVDEPVHVWQVPARHRQITAARTDALSLGCAPYVCWVDDDDELTPGVFQVLIDALDANPHACGVFCTETHVGEEDVVLAVKPAANEAWTLDNMINQHPFVHHIALMRRSLLPLYLPLIQSYPLVGDQLLIWLMAQSGPWVHVPIEGYRWRRWSGQVTMDKDISKEFESARTYARQVFEMS